MVDNLRSLKVELGELISQNFLSGRILAIHRNVSILAPAMFTEFFRTDRSL